jgi:regulator of sigma E protease
MIDESMDKEQMNQPAQPWEFRSKPAWQRLIIMLGGVTVNLFLGFFIFAMIAWAWGDEYLPAKNLKYGVYVDSLGKSIGLQDGDKIISVNGRELEDFARLSANIILDEAKTIQVERNGQLINVPVPAGTIRQIIKRKGESLAYPKYPAIVDSIGKGAKFLSGTLQKDDEIIALNEQPVRSFAEFTDLKRKQSDIQKEKPVDLTVLRNGRDTVQIKMLLQKNGTFGFFARPMDQFIDFAVKKYSFVESLPAGVKKGWSTLVMNVQNLKLLFTSKEVKPSESLGSFITIGNMFGAEWDWQRFWSLTALLSIVLAFMNILPVPGLDGGHVLFTLYEMVTGRKPGDKFLEYAQVVGMILLLGIMVYALGLDIFRLFK